ncbi:hypothetical protein C5167_031203, partial [Papaver somniferum]
MIFINFTYGLRLNKYKEKNELLHTIVKGGCLKGAGLMFSVALTRYLRNCDTKQVGKGKGEEQADCYAYSRFCTGGNISCNNDLNDAFVINDCH